jgi:diguanylate cyclase (GGDEF)-like protein
MQNKVLQSIIEMTRQRDLDSLEYSLVATLVELVPVVRISLYKLIAGGPPGKIEEIVRLDTETDRTGETRYAWDDEARVVDAGPHLEKCLKLAQPLDYEGETGLKHILIPVLSDEKLFGALSLGARRDLSPFLSLLEGIVKIYGNNLAILNESERDKLTGLLNRRTFDDKLTRLLKAQSGKKSKYSAKRGRDERRKLEPGSHAWLVILDIDNFKQVNDTYGHVYGDEVILLLSQKMRVCFRNSDLLFRFGGEEFVVILEPTTLEMATRVLERFRKAVSEHDFPGIGRITVSIGFARISGSDHPPTVLDNADKALYHAKEHGRNRIDNYETLLAEGKLFERDTSGPVDLF